MPLVYSVDGMAAKEARAFERRTASLLASKLDRRYSEMCGIVRSRMALAVVRNNTLLLRSSRMTKAATFQTADGADLSQMERINTRHKGARMQRERATRVPERSRVANEEEAWSYYLRTQRPVQQS